MVGGMFGEKTKSLEVGRWEVWRFGEPVGVPGDHEQLFCSRFP